MLWSMLEKQMYQHTSSGKIQEYIRWLLLSTPAGKVTCYNIRAALKQLWSVTRNTANGVIAETSKPQLQDLHIYASDTSQLQPHFFVLPSSCTCLYSTMFIQHDPTRVRHYMNTSAHIPASESLIASSAHSLEHHGVAATKAAHCRPQRAN